MEVGEEDTQELGSTGLYSKLAPSGTIMYSKQVVLVFTGSLSIG